MNTSVSSSSGAQDGGTDNYARITRNGALMGVMDNYAKTVSATEFIAKEWLTGHATWTIAANTTATTPKATFSSNAATEMPPLWPGLKVGDFFELDVYISGRGFTLTLTGGTGVSLVGASTTVAALNSVVLQGGNNYKFQWRWTVATRGSETASVYVIGANGGGTDIKPVVSVSAAATLTVQQSGHLIAFGGTGAYQITLPVATTAAGVHYTLTHSVLITGGNITIRPAANNNMVGVCLSPTGGVTSAGNSVLTFDEGVSVIGDGAQIWCDGITWSFMAFSRVNAGVFAA